MVGVSLHPLTHTTTMQGNWEADRSNSRSSGPPRPPAALPAPALNPQTARASPEPQRAATKQQAHILLLTTQLGYEERVCTRVCLYCKHQHQKPVVKLIASEPEQERNLEFRFGLYGWGAVYPAARRNSGRAETRPCIDCYIDGYRGSIRRPTPCVRGKVAGAGYKHYEQQ